MSLVLHEKDGAVRFAVKAVPGASRDRIAGPYADGIKVQVAAAPEGGRANERILELLAAALAVPVRAVAVVHGAGSPRKVVAVQGLSAAEVRARLLGGT